MLDLKFRKAQLQAELDQTRAEAFFCAARKRHCTKLMYQFVIPNMELINPEDNKYQELVTELDKRKLDIKSKAEQKISELKLEEREKQYLAWY